MKITVASDDGQKVVDVYAEDIDFVGHSLNWVILTNRFEQAVKEVFKQENQSDPAPVQGR